jgi:hypothetical protein
MAIAAVAAFAVGALAALVSAEPAVAGRADSVLTIDADGYRYTYQVVTGDESLFDLRADPHELHDLSRSRRALTLELRRALETKLHVDSLETLRTGKADTIRTLKSLGYL